MAIQQVPSYLIAPQFDMPSSWQTVAEIAFLGAAVATLVVAGVLSRRRRSAAPFLYTLGGGATALNEATLAHLSHATHSQHGAHVAWTAQGIGVPVYALGAYFPYFGIVLLIFVPLFQRRALSVRAVWASFLAIVIGVFAFEAPWMAAGLWHYYGRQSLQPFHWMPVWYAFAAAVMTLLPAVIVARTVHLFEGARQLLLVPVVIMTSIGGVVAVSWPMYLAMSSTWPGPVVHLAAVTTVGLSALVVWVCVPLVTAPASADGHESRPAAEAPVASGGNGRRTSALTQPVS